MALRRFRRDGDAVNDSERGGVATTDRPGTDTRDANGNGVQERRPRGAAAVGATAVATDRDARLRQRDVFGGFNFGAAFFGWLVAVGMAVIVTAILSAAGAAIGLTTGSASAKDAGTITIVGGALLVAALALAYYCGGYVAGRMSRFDGGRQGFGTWLTGLIVTLLIGAAGAIFGEKYNVFNKLDLPRIPIKEGDLATGGGIALAALVLATLLAAIVGGKAGQRYHRRVDRAALPDERY
ncbi:MAG: hypothetical protein QOD53_493 [Thermoleophilaceae bacterium]|nr:hypothetical protein [Thermoleophilaceae bacterium]